MKAKSATIDGELVCVDESGVADFARLHSRCHDGAAFLYAFDLLELAGEDLRQRPLLERKTLLVEMLANSKVIDGIHPVDHAAGAGAALFREACKLGLEGLVSKKADSIYRSGPRATRAWIKIKNPHAPSVLRIRDGLEG